MTISVYKNTNLSSLSWQHITDQGKTCAGNYLLTLTLEDGTDAHILELEEDGSFVCVPSGRCGVTAHSIENDVIERDEEFVPNKDLGIHANWNGGFHPKWEGA